jgi:hypothetical protein
MFVISVTVLPTYQCNANIIDYCCRMVANSLHPSEVSDSYLCPDGGCTKEKTHKMLLTFFQSLLKYSKTEA